MLFGMNPQLAVDVAAIAYARANEDGETTPEELATELERAVVEVGHSLLRQQRAALLGGSVKVMRPTTVIGGEPLVVREWIGLKSGAAATATAAKLKANTTLITGLSATLLAVGTGMFGPAGLSLGAAGAMLLPHATEILSALRP